MELVDPSQGGRVEGIRTAVPQAVPQPRLARVEKSLARVLRGGALASFTLFAASLGLELLPSGHAVEVAIDALRKAAVSLLLGTPVVRLGLSGLMLGARGEWRYAAYAAAVLALLGLAVGVHYAG